VPSKYTAFPLDLKSAERREGEAFDSPVRRVMHAQIWIGDFAAFGGNLRNAASALNRICAKAALRT
jgi:hypothetical protein